MLRPGVETGLSVCVRPVLCVVCVGCFCNYWIGHTCSKYWLPVCAALLCLLL